MFTFYNLLKFLHIIGVIVWVGGVVVMLALITRLLRSRDNAMLGALGKQGKFLSGALFGPAAALTLISGIALVIAGKLSFGALWITWGMTGIILSSVIGGAMVGRAAAKLAKQIAAGHVDPDTVTATWNRIRMLNVLNLLLLLSIVFAMVFKIS